MRAAVRKPFWSVLIVFMTFASVATAAPRAGRERALELFEKSARAYREGRFQDAVELLLEARGVKSEPVLLYNLGRAYEAMGKPTQAADAYAGYLREDPRATDRGAIEGRIATLRMQATQLETAKMAPAEERKPPPEPPPERDEPSRPVVVPWVLVGIGAVGVGTGIGLAAAADRRHDDAVREPAQVPAQEKQAEAESFATGATIACVAGGLFTAAGLAWLGILAFSPSRNVSLLPGPGAITLRSTF